MKSGNPKQALTTCCAAHTLHDGLSDLTYVLLPLLAQTFGLTLAQVGMIRAALSALFQAAAFAAFAESVSPRMPSMVPVARPISFPIAAAISPTRTQTAIANGDTRTIRLHHSYTE